MEDNTKLISNYTVASDETRYNTSNLVELKGLFQAMTDAMYNGATHFNMTFTDGLMESSITDGNVDVRGAALHFNFMKYDNDKLMLEMKSLQKRVNKIRQIITPGKPVSAIDHESMLSKYIDHVGLSEGSDFIKFINSEDGLPKFTQDEVVELNRLANE